MENIQNQTIDFKDNAIDTKEGKLILDSHKLSYHYDRVEASTLS